VARSFECSGRSVPFAGQFGIPSGGVNWEMKMSPTTHFWCIADIGIAPDDHFCAFTLRSRADIRVMFTLLRCHDTALTTSCGQQSRTRFPKRKVRCFWRAIRPGNAKWGCTDSSNDASLATSWPSSNRYFAAYSCFRVSDRVSDKRRMVCPWTAVGECMAVPAVLLTWTNDPVV
jgi:hypothetical protein